ncbi:MAG: ABC transporter permease [Mesorhizobium sp.]
MAANSKTSGPGRFRLGSDTVVNVYFLLWFCLVIIPLIVLFAFSFFETKSFVTTYRPTLNTWLSLLDSGRLTVSLRTLRIALTVTLIEFIIAFPFSLWLAKGKVSKSTQAIVLALLTIPFFLDLSSRIIIWRSILSENGLISHLIVQSGLTSSPVDWLLYNEWAVHFGMLLTYFPTMVLPIYMAISIIDDSLIQASGDLGASRKDTLFRIIVPLSLPGILAGFILTLGPALAAWIEPSMLGGGFVNLLSNSVESAYGALRYPVVAALSSFVMILLAALVIVLAIVARRFGNLGSIFSALRS